MRRQALLFLATAAVAYVAVNLAVRKQQATAVQGQPAGRRALRSSIYIGIQFLQGDHQLFNVIITVHALHTNQTIKIKESNLNMNRF